MPTFDPLPGPANSSLILVVDDEPKNIQVVGPMLLRQGHEVIAAGSGEEALAKLRSTTPDLVLMDVMMPGMTGFDLCRRLRSQPEWQDIPVIFLSAVTDKSFIMEALAAGAVDYVTKPFHGPELLSRVQVHLNLQSTRKRLAEAIDERNRVLEVVAHDLKNPLGAVRFASSMLQEQSASMDQTHSALVASIGDATDRALEIVGSLLQTRQIEEAKAEMGLTSLCLREYTEEAIKSFLPLGKRKSIAISMESSGERIPVQADRRSLLCSLENLVSNAIKFSPHGTLVRISLQRDAKSGVFLIDDEGPGVAEDERDQLFKKFTRLSSRPTGGEVSTGLGLHIVRELVEAMGGSIRYERGPRGGACFVLRLPLAE
ncbi:hybrid sensor histidine kinase/response regulator [Luteolibacter sp. GHJ8]|uniref:histidine kinase n=1 Tax=Luteolibacter rhizosphaerae TaxID=2989719 RepID=A0ABT3FZE4_9BACT|nr:hybrid sensor histidine kinase/response regulator [Luteolibacter rhizosphaerae]MCW1912699.1 hybrid sensor histidine kinase/response regulator [Luteolibacter rhizosphaerae]